MSSAPFRFGQLIPQRCCRRYAYQQSGSRPGIRDAPHECGQSSAERLKVPAPDFLRELNLVRAIPSRYHLCDKLASTMTRLPLVPSLF